jgi:molybdopterin molybdotransferase
VAELLTIDEALRRIKEHAQLLAVETVAVSDAAGRVLREPALSRVDLPPFASSAMDGFAVRADETPGELSVAFRVAAGSSEAQSLPVGVAAGIATGAAVPEGADAVVPVERTADHGHRVEIPEPAASGQHVRPRGGDVRVGDVVAESGTRLGAAQIGALSAVGVAEVRCSVRPRVAVLATGSELQPAGELLAHGQIYESNRAMIAAALRTVGADVELLPVVDDDEPAHRVALEQGLAADVLVTSGGVSMGPHDLVRRVAAGLGVEEVFWGVAVKPGKPLSFGVRGATMIFGLPGNPVSALVGALVFVRPALLARQGATIVDPQYEYGRVVSTLRRNPQRDEFVRARRVVRDDGVMLDPVSGQDSHMIVRAAAASALIHVPRGDGELTAATPARYLRLE